MFHTHPAKRGRKLRSRTMKWKWGWKGDEDEVKMKMRWKLLNKNTRRGTHKKKRRNQEKTPTPTHLARSGRTLKRQGKWKSGGRRKQTKTGGGGGGRKRLSKPKPQRKQGLPKHARTKTYLERGSTHEIGDQLGPSWWQTKPKNGIQSLPTQFVLYSHYGNEVGQPIHVTAAKSSRIGCATGLPHQDNQKKVVPNLKACPCTFSWWKFDCDQSPEQSGKRRFHSVPYDIGGKGWWLPHPAASSSTRRQTTWDLEKGWLFPLTYTNSWIKMCEFRSQVSRPSPIKGSLQWVHGTMLEPPWKSH